MFKRKLYDTLLSWKTESNGSTALLIEGARRVGKSRIAVLGKPLFGSDKKAVLILVSRHRDPLTMLYQKNLQYIQGSSAF